MQNTKAQNMQTWQKTCEYAKGQKMQTYNGAKHANMQRPKLCKHEKAQNMQTFKVAKDANIQRRKTFKHATA